jgi:foldase protein PrsA
VRKFIRQFVACGAVAVMATGAAACKSVEPYAAKVNGVIVSKADIDDELQAIRDNPQYRQAIEQSVPVTGSGSDTFNSSFVAQVIKRRIYFELIHQELVRRNLKVKESDLALSRQEVDSSMPSPGVFAKFPKSYRTWLVRTNAEVDILQNNLAKVTDANLRAYYDEHKDQFESVCAAHILVGTKAQADSIEKQIAKAKDKNATFSEIAKKSSTDTGSGAQGGDLGCASPSTYVAEFKDAVRTQKVGVIGPPVKSQFGYHIIRVDKRDEAKSFDEVKDEVRTAMTEGEQGAFNEFLSKASKTADIEVNPRYGTYDTTGTAGDVVPPKAPDAATDNNSTGG